MCEMCYVYLSVCVGYVCSSHTSSLLVKNLSRFYFGEEPTTVACDQKLPNSLMVSKASSVSNLHISSNHASSPLTAVGLARSKY